MKVKAHVGSRDVRLNLGIRTCGHVDHVSGLNVYIFAQVLSLEHLLRIDLYDLDPIILNLAEHQDLRVLGLV